MQYIFSLTIVLVLFYKEIIQPVPKSFNISHSITTSSNSKYSNNKICERDSSGFYLVITDTTKLNGYKLRDKNEYYYLAQGRIICLNEVDKVHINYNSYISRYTLSVDFNKNAAQKWYAFTSENIGMSVGLFIEGELYHVAKIIEPITDGKTILTNSEDKNNLVELKDLITKESNK